MDRNNPKQCSGFFCYSFFAQAANSLIKVFCVVRPLKFEHGIFFVMAQKGT